MGNIKGNRYWEARLPKDFRRPPSGNPNPELASFIRAKYVDRAYAATDAQPPTIDNYLDHPYAAGEESSAPAASAAPQAPSGVPLRLSPAKASASSPALTVDLLGGFDDILSSPAAVLPNSPPAAVAAAAANNDPFSYGAFVSAPAAPATGSTVHRNSLEWSDFHAASPAPVPFAQPPSAAQHALQSQASLHQRSYSEGLPAATPSATASFFPSQPSRKGLGAVPALAQLDSQPGHSRTQSHPPPNGNSLDLSLPNASSHQQPQQPAQPAGPAPDPFGSLQPVDDLLAGLTIHHIMDSMPGSSHPEEHSGASSAPASAGPQAHAAAAAAADPFQFSSSATPGDHRTLARGSSHKRHSSSVKSSEEILRLFDTESSTGKAAAAASTAGAAAVGASEDPFGDFLGAGGLAASARTVAVPQPTAAAGAASAGQLENGHHVQKPPTALVAPQRPVQTHMGIYDTVPLGLQATAMVPNLL